MFSLGRRELEQTIDTTSHTATRNSRRNARGHSRSIRANSAQTRPNRPHLDGGSRQTRYIKALIAQPELDGARVGGASLDPAFFASIVHY
ncbi:MAG: triose-phosphate isomerase [Bryobacterales bacterium]|nr:triose-phosphate isomerase [Bryobacterales bacterium]MBV9397634.1 triose-phosphate isomerase [Bryobacterales bacterium]